MRDISTKTFAASVPLELRLLIICARTRLDDASAAQLRTLVGAGVDWEEVLKGARRHGVMPLLHRHLSGLGTFGVPAPVLEKLGSYARKNAVHNLMLAHALLGVLKALEQQGVAAVPYKGPVLASSAYGDVSLRSFKDLDVIVQPQDFGRASATLQRLGYALSDKNPDGHFHESFVQPETGVQLELHHDVLQRRYFPTPLELSRMWRDLTRVPLLGQPVTSFTPEDTLLLLCLHGSKHAWQGLTWIGDVSEFVKAHPALDWELVLQKAEQARLSRMVLLGLHLAHTVLEAPLPEGVQQVLKTDPKLVTLSQQIVTRMHEKRGPLGEATLTHRLQLAMRSGLLRVPLYLKFVTFLLRPNAQDRAAAHLPAGWTFGYYLVRPLRLIRRYLLPKAKVASK
jgi:hypothetical protein